MVQRLLALLLITLQSISSMKIALINGGSDFFDAVENGWNEKCNRLGIECLVMSTKGLEDGCGARRDFAQQLIDQKIDGVAYKGCRTDQEPLDKLVEAGIPVVTFDSDYPDSGRVAYVGTDNNFLGRTMAKLLRQLRPEGGSYAMISYKEERVEGFIEEIERYNDMGNFGHWYDIELDANFTRNFIGSRDKNYMEQMEQLVRYNPSAFLIFTQTPMSDENWTSFVDQHRASNITYIGTDGSDFQLDYLSRRYVDGLVGQLPYEMGSFSAQALYDYISNGSLPRSTINTNVVSYNLIPVELPPLDQDQSLLGNLTYVGYICFSIVGTVSLCCIMWTVINRNNIVIKAAQPVFLGMVAFGILIAASTIIPLSYDDSGAFESTDGTFRTGICMSVPWLGFIGFTIVFSALFSKTWRVNRLFHAKVRHARIQVTEKDVIVPFAVLLFGNILILLLWTLLDPLEYVRQEDIGTDYWNRVLSSYGVCRSDKALAYLVPLSVLNFIAVTIAIWQAYQARNITSVFSEASYISLSVNSVFQAFLTGIPVIVVVRDTPEAFYLVLTFTIFLLSMAVLLLIFLPKMSLVKEYAGKSEQEQKRMLAEGIMQSDSRLRRNSNIPSSGLSNGLRKHNEDKDGSDEAWQGAANNEARPVVRDEIDLGGRNTSHSTPEIPAHMNL